MILDLYYPISPTKLVLSLFLPLYLAYNGLQKKRLTFSGALAGWFSPFRILNCVV